MTALLDTREILAQRARDLAAPLATDRDDGHDPYFTFELDKSRYALPAQHVAGLFRLEHLAVLPGASTGIAGLTAWRGRLLTVLDLREVLGLATSGLDDRAWVVAITDGSHTRGLLAGINHNIERIVPDAIRKCGTDSGPIQGVTANAAQILNAIKLLDSEE